MSVARNSDSGNFSGEYKKTGFYQTEYNEIFLDSVIECIKVNFSTHIQDGKLLNILDIGAGAGLSTVQFQEKLKSAGINAMIEATDISESQIAAAKPLANENLSFRVEAAEALDVKKKYHVVTCLFAYHWFEDKEGVASRIKASMTDDGLFFSMIPLEKPKFFALRQANVGFWRSYFDNIKINPLVEDPTFYQKIFAEEFPHVQMEYKRNAHEFSEEKFSSWMGSWTPEMRATTKRTRSNQPIKSLPPQLKRKILSTFTQGISEGSADEDVSYRMEAEEKVIQFGERLVVFGCSIEKPLQMKLTAPDVLSDNPSVKRIKRFK